MSRSLRASLLVILVRGVTTVMTALRSAFLSCTWCTLISNTLPMAHCRPCRGRILTLLCSMRAALPCCVLTAGQAVVVVQETQALFPLDSLPEKMKLVANGDDVEYPDEPEPQPDDLKRIGHLYDPPPGYKEDLIVWDYIWTRISGWDCRAALARMSNKPAESAPTYKLPAPPIKEVSLAGTEVYGSLSDKQAAGVLSAAIGAACGSACAALAVLGAGMVLKTYAGAVANKILGALSVRARGGLEGAYAQGDEYGTPVANVHEDELHGDEYGTPPLVCHEGGGDGDGVRVGEEEREGAAGSDAEMAFIGVVHGFSGVLDGRYHLIARKAVCPLTCPAAAAAGRAMRAARMHQMQVPVPPQPRPLSRFSFPIVS